MLSYAQNYEDVMLRRCFPSLTDGFYIDVGAMDPVHDSVTKHFYDLGWRGINIEPNDFFYRKLMHDRPRDINLNLAVGEKEEFLPFHVFEQYGISTLDASHRDRFTRGGYQSVEKSIPTTTLATICREYVHQDIQFLKIDCEGWEKHAVAGFDWEHFRPTIVVIEATEPLSQAPAWFDWEPILLENGRYGMVYFDGLNRFYLRREYSDLKKHFQVPPNVFDDFTPYALDKARREGIELTQKLEAQVVETYRIAGLLDSKSQECQAREELFKTQRRADQADYEAKLQQAESTIEDLKARLTDAMALKDKLMQSRLWIGQLSQDIAALRG